MIFVTVGTHEQQFNRLVKSIDELKRDGRIKEEVFIQTGFSTYEPKSCEWSNWCKFQQMTEYVNKARIIITHGGPSSFVMPLQIGKIPIVVPRRKDLGEHVNNHQVNFCRIVSERQGNIIFVKDIEKLGGIIENYDSIVAAMPAEIKSNNKNFCSKLEQIVDEMF